MIKLKSSDKTFDVSKLAAGVYIARFQIDGVQKDAIKFVKE